MQSKGNPKNKPTGIEKRHTRKCPSSATPGAACKCKGSYRAFVYDPRSGHKVRRTFPTMAAAKAWRADATSKRNHGSMITPTRRTLRDTAEAWLVGAEAEPPTILNRSGRPYKPSALRELRRNLIGYVLPELGAVRLSEVRRGDLQALVDRLTGRGLSGSKVRNVIIAVRVLYRHAIERDEVQANPTSGLRLPNGTKPRDRAATGNEAAALLAALPEHDRALWATAFYAGLRRGELQALRWDDVDLAAGIIHVRRGWDEVAGEIEPKSAKSKRTVPIVGLLRDYLAELKTRTGRGGSMFVFGRGPDEPFTPSSVRTRAARAWAEANTKREAKGQEPLVPIGLHECRHTCVSQMSDAGLSLELIGDYIGHSSAYMVDRYRHLLEGHEADSARILDAYHARADTAARIEQMTDPGEAA